MRVRRLLLLCQLKNDTRKGAVLIHQHGCAISRSSALLHVKNRIFNSLLFPTEALQYFCVLLRFV